ncbi:NUDIX domain-containing protein [Actinoplanes sp. NPDC049118]|uniref:NUDIX domain-containing protein n=1 Tax=Actinoplanes sp. NPDC049118 TaxID=3155769 RepID=UPI0033C0BAFD
MPDRYLHCTFCGARFVPGQPWPRRCGACGEASYLNPKPVAVAVQPVGGGLLVVRRGIPPAEKTLALPGGYIDVGETWEQAAARELSEETGLAADPGAARLYDTISAPDGTLLVFGLFPALSSADELPPVEANTEVLDRLVLHGPEPLGFELHTRVANRYFAQVAAGM